MPVYEYICSNCGNDFEALVFSKDAEEAVRCPRCDGGSIEKRLSVFTPSSGAGSEAPSSAGTACGGCSMAGEGACGLIGGQG